MLAGIPPTVYGDGRQARDFIFVGDVVKANLAAADAKMAPGKTYNICSGTAITILDLVNSLNSLLSSEISPTFDPPRPGDIYRSLGDPSRAMVEMNFSAQTSLDEGLAITADWMRLG
jgi:UDP-glucose 4-epimerase